MTTRQPYVFSPQTLKQEWLVSLAVVGFLILGEFVGITGPLRGVISQSVVPLNIAVARLMQVTVTPFIYVGSLTTAQRRVQDLERRYAEASAQLGELDALRAENDAMKQLLDAEPLAADQRVLSMPIVAYGRPLIVGGQNQGIELGNMVLVSQTLVGLVTHVAVNQSEIGLISQESGPTILAKTESGIQALVKGDGKRVLLTEVPVDAKLTIGERVMTQGQEGVAPNIFIGRIASIRNDPASAVQTAVLEQLVSFYEASIVEVR